MFQLAMCKYLALWPFDIRGLTTPPLDPVCSCWISMLSCSALWSHGLKPTRFSCPWDSPGKNTGIDCHFLLPGVFPTQGWNPRLLWLLPCRQILYHWATGEAQILLPSCILVTPRSFPGGSVMKNRLQGRSHRRRGFHPWVGKTPWRRKWQPAPVFLPGESWQEEEPGGLYGP